MPIGYPDPLSVSWSCSVACATGHGNFRFLSNYFRQLLLLSLDSVEVGHILVTVNYIK